METGGKLLASIRDQLQKLAEPGVTFEALEAEAQRLIAKGGAKPSFSTVPGYHWATCIMKNDALCHGIPKNGVVAAGDIITIDVGLIFGGFHTDASVTFPVGSVPASTLQFLELGRASLADAISAAHQGGSVYDISLGMEQRARKAGFGLVAELTGHGVGSTLHQEPNIPCFAHQSDRHKKLRVGQTLAIEIMYTMGSPKLTIDSDHWTYRSADRSLTGMFEDTVVITKEGVAVLTNPSVTGIL